MADKPWSTVYTGSNPLQDPDPVDQAGVQETHDNFTDRALASTVNTLRDKVDALARVLGDSASLPDGSIAEILDRDHANGDATQVRFRVREAAPTHASDIAFIYPLDDAGTTKLYVKWSDGTETEIGGGGGGTDQLVKVTSNDTTAGYLDAKLVVNANCALAKNELNDGGDEDLEIDIDVDALSEKTAPVAADLFLIEDTGDSNNHKKLQGSNLVAEKWRESGSQVLTAGAIADGQVVARSGTTLVGQTKRNLNASAVPTADDDTGDGYSPGSLWVDTTADKAYVCLDATSTAAVWTEITQSGGSGFTAYEEEFTAVAGANEFTLSATPAVNTNTLSGRNILGVFRNGVRSRYLASITLANEYSQSGGNDRINVTGQAGGELFTVVFGV